MPKRTPSRLNPTARTSPEMVKTALEALVAPYARSDAPGLVIGVAHQGRVLLRRGAGMASLEHGVANTAATRMRIGSASKQFTCLAVLLLAEEGLLGVDDPLDRHVPELPYPLGVPTLRQLMTHTGGMRCHIDVAAVAAGLEIQPRGTAMATMKRQTGANFAPGSAQIYCNSGYHLLSVVVDRVSGVPFERFLAERIFAPLGLRDTESLPSDLQLREGMATLHVPHPDGTPGRWQRGIFVSHEVRGEGGMVSTVDDMLAWLQHLRGASRRVGSDASWQAMVTPAVLDNGLALPYALGLFVVRYRGLDLVYHTGAVLGGASQVLTVPAHGLDIAIMTNGAPVSPAALAKRVIDIVLAEHLDGPVEPRLAGLRRFAHLDGTIWRDDEGAVVGFAKVGNKLGISYLFSPHGPLLRDEGRTLRVAAEDAGLGPFVFDTAELKAGARGQPPRQITVLDCGRPLLLRRVPARAPSVASLAARLAGRYRSDELDADAVIAVENGSLVMRLAGSHGHAVVDLTPVAADLMRMAWRGERSPTMGALLVLADGLRISTFRTRGAKLQRVAR